MTYKAKEFQLVEPFVFEIKEKELPALRQGELLLKPLVAGICGSEILYFKGQKSEKKLKERLPMALLHEGTAEVVETGPETSMEKGQKVVVFPMLPCGNCDACKEGFENGCQKSRFMAATADGLARTLFVYREENVVAIPEEIGLDEAALTEPTAIAVNGVNTAEWKGREKVAVIGDGPIGYLTALVASFVRKIPKEDLFFLGIIDEKLKLAEEFATPLNSISQKEEIEKLQGKLDIVLECVGGKAQEITLNQGIGLLKPRGQLIVLGLTDENVPLMTNPIVNKGLVLKGSVRSTKKDFEKVVELLKDHGFRKQLGKIICDKRFVIKGTEDLKQAFEYADTEGEHARNNPGRVMVEFP